MPNHVKNITIITVIIIITVILSPGAHAQIQPSDVAGLYPITDDQAVDGDILVYSDKGLVRAASAYTNKMFGVYQTKPLLIYKPYEATGTPLVRSGIATVNVKVAGGQIKAGDYVTSSSEAGKGQKATISGYALGVALADATTDTKIPVAVRIEYVELTNTRSVLRLLDYFNLAAFQSGQDPEKASQLIKYLAAALIVLGSLVFSFLVFARSITKSVEAIGRNPLAKSAIMLSITINAGLTLGTILIGIGAAYLILRL